MTVPETILVASHNAGKIAEITELFTPLGVKVTSAAELAMVRTGYIYSRDYRRIGMG